MGEHIVRRQRGYPCLAEQRKHGAGDGLTVFVNDGILDTSIVLFKHEVE